MTEVLPAIQKITTTKGANGMTLETINVYVQGPDLKECKKIFDEVSKK